VRRGTFQGGDSGVEGAVRVPAQEVAEGQQIVWPDLCRFAAGEVGHCGHHKGRSQGRDEWRTAFYICVSI
jgi:hypothetical protein